MAALPEPLLKLLADFKTGEALIERNGWLCAGTRQLYPIFDGIPIIQPDGMYKVTGLLHLVRAAHRAQQTAQEKGVVAVIAPEEAAGCEAVYAAHRLDHYKDAGDAFWRIVEQMTAETPENRDGWALDMGCGYGFDMVALCQRFDFVLGVEPQLDRCVTARTFLTEMGFTNFAILCGTGEEIPLTPGLFDLITANQVVEHMADRPRSFAQLERLLKPGGQFVFALPTRYSLRPEPHVYLMFLGWLPRWLQGPYARWRGRSERYAEYTNLISHRALAKQLRAAFGAAPRILSAAEAYLPRSPRAKRLIGIFKALARGPLRPFLVEFEGAQVGTVRKPLTATSPPPPAGPQTR